MQAGAVWVIVRNPRVQSNEIQVLMQKNLAPCTYSFKESCHQVLFIAIIFEPHSSSIQGLDCIYCPQPAELHCDSSCSAPTGMPELEGKDFDSPGARSFLAVTYLGLTGVAKLCPLFSALEPGESSSVWSSAGTGIPPGQTQESPCG